MHGGVIALDPRSKSSEFQRSTLVSAGEPGVQLPRLPLLDYLHQGLSQLIEFLEDGIGLADALDERPLVYREPLLVCDKQPGGLPG